MFILFFKNKKQKLRTIIAERGNNASGFTLVELMVSLTLFVFVVLAAVSSLYAVNDASRKVNAMRGVLDNLNFAIESMSRTIRTSSNIVCGGSANPPGATHNCPFPAGPATSQLSLHSTLGQEEDIEYYLNGATHQIMKRINGQASVAITAPEIYIQSFYFYVDGANATDVKQPSVMILMQGIATASTGDTTPFAIHTYISQRAFK